MDKICNKYLTVLKWNAVEFCFYIILGITLPLSYFLDIFQNIGTISSVFFSVFTGILLIRFFTELEKLDNLSTILHTLLDSIKIWEGGIQTLSKKWGGQLDWLKRQALGHKSIGKPSRYLFPHKFHEINIDLINKLPNKKGKFDFSKLKGSLISINHKISANLNFMLEKIHFRESLDETEINEIKSLLFGNPTSIIPILEDEIPKARRDIENKLIRLGYEVKE